MSQTPGRQISGGAILRAVRDAYAPLVRPFAAGRKVAVVRIQTRENDPLPWRQRGEAARVSAEQKVKTFTALGLNAEHLLLPADTSVSELGDRIAALNADPQVVGIILQMPVSARLRPLAQTIAPGKDLDALGDDSPWRACATAQAIVRITAPFLTADRSVAVVGARGFVGSGVVRLLNDEGVRPVQLDLGDDLGAVRDSAIVIATSGQPGLLTDQHLHQGHVLVVDCGYMPDLHGGVAGDVHPSAQGLPQHITPVPGGIGPTEMAVLVERVAAGLLTDPAGPWRYLGPERGVELPTGLTQIRD
ncbi:MAG TPA: tetrahydrofolate dehydrogenase/cyclohydrolase catalytic domain-containing protein [Kineosporiaceae bacterium]|nr:tetrahydrofolate dehydrogenase/cyclohydrolase catalytic domain-containing protein [Kineosporiaceae bacterium]